MYLYTFFIFPGNKSLGVPSLQVFQATPTTTTNNKNNNQQFSQAGTNNAAGTFSLQVNFDKQQQQRQTLNPRDNIEVILNQLSKEKQQKFLSQFAELNFEQQTYAYNQFLSTPPEIQEFALNQFITLDPKVLILSIQTELDSENEVEGQFGQQQPLSLPRVSNELSEPSQPQPQQPPIRSSPLTLTSIDQSRFQTQFSSGPVLVNNNNNNNNSNNNNNNNNKDRGGP